jgi:hypothetical protein
VLSYREKLFMVKIQAALPTDSKFSCRLFHNDTPFLWQLLSDKYLPITVGNMETDLMRNCSYEDLMYSFMF